MKIPSPHKIHFIVIVILLVLNIAGFKLVKDYTDLIAQDRLSLASSDIENRVMNRIDSYSHILYSAAALFAVSDQINASNWTRYVETAKLTKDYYGISALGYAPVVSAQDLDSFKNKLSKQGVSDFSIYPAQPTPLYAPILFIDPESSTSENGTGYNLFSDPLRKSALDYAMNNDTFAVTDKISNNKDNTVSSDSMIAMYYPIYKLGSDRSTQESRQANIQGFILARIKSTEFLKELTLKAAPGLDFQIFDNSTNGTFVDRSLLYNSGSDKIISPGFVPRYSSNDTIILPNTNWYIRFTAVTDKQLGKLFGIAPYIIGFIDLLLSILFFLLIRTLLKMYFVSNKQNLQYAEKLIYEDVIVDGFDTSIIMTDESGRIIVFNKKAEQLLGYTESEIVKKYYFTNLVSKKELEAKTLTTQESTGIMPANEFETIIMNCLLDGKEKCQWGLIDKQGVIHKTNLVIQPVYDTKKQLIGYKFSF